MVYYCFTHINHRSCIISWLVVWTPLKNISHLGWWFPIYRKIKHVPNHQPVSGLIQYNYETVLKVNVYRQSRVFCGGFDDLVPDIEPKLLLKLLADLNFHKSWPVQDTLHDSAWLCRTHTHLQKENYEATESIVGFPMIVGYSHWFPEFWVNCSPFPPVLAHSKLSNRPSIRPMYWRIQFFTFTFTI